MDDFCGKGILLIKHSVSFIFWSEILTCIKGNPPDTLNLKIQFDCEVSGRRSEWTGDDMVRSLAGQPAMFQPITLRRTLREGEFTESQLSDHLYLSYVSNKPLSMNFFKKQGVTM